MKITWSKHGSTMEGRVGDVLCFYMIAEHNRIELVCDLPEAVPNAVGRYVTNHHTPQAAAKHAADVLENWKTRILR